jgi:molecular chaperone GrpE
MKPTSTSPSTPGVEGVDSGAAAPTELERLRSELAAQQARESRLANDFESFRRRTRQETETRATAQKNALILELLPALDNLERALSPGTSIHSHQLQDGVAMTLTQLRQLLTKHGIEGRDILGEQFDPHQHEAIAQRHNRTLPDQTILAVTQRGYHQGSQVLRPAQVVVNDLTGPGPGHHGA